MNRKVRILILEDQPNDVELMLREIRRAGYDPEWRRVETEADYVAQLDQGWEIILADYSLPQFNGLRALELLKARGWDVPFILVSAYLGEERAVAAMRSGANDYVMKDHLGRLGTAIGRELRDVAERRQRLRAEAALLETERRYRILFDRAIDGIFLLSEEGKLVSVNESFARMHGYRVEEMLGMRLQDLDTPESSRLAPARMRRLLAGEALTFEVEHYHKDGHVFSLDVSASQIVFDGKSFIQCFHRDITERKRAEGMLRLEGAALEAVANSILITDRAGTIEWVNAAFTAASGYSAGEAVGMNPRLLKSGMQDPAFYKEMWDTISAGKVWQGEMINRRKDGSLYSEEQTITPLLDDHGAITHFIAVKQDVTKRRLLEEELRQSQKMEAVGVLAGGVAHDFNNLLAVIAGNIGFMRMDTTAEEKEHALKGISNATDRAANLVRQLLAFSRRQVMQVKTVNLNDLVSNMARMLQRIIGEDIALETCLLPGDAMLRADPGMIEQVLMNLAVNARDAMPGGGRIDIMLSHVSVGEATTALHPHVHAGDFVRLSMHDTGCGMEPGVMGRIFDPFFTTKEVGKGSGLGLSTVLGIVEQHHGWVDVTSKPGQGTVFHVYLPRLKGAEKAEPREAVAERPRGGTETVLVVEDEPALREILARTLKRFGYTVITAESGAAALELWPQLRDAVDLLLTDVIMPKGISGWQLAEQLRDEKPGLKVICMSGYPGEMTELGLKPGEDMIFLKKPFSHTTLLQAMRDCLDAGLK